MKGHNINFAQWSRHRTFRSEQLYKLSLLLPSPVRQCQRGYNTSINICSAINKKLNHIPVRPSQGKEKWCLVRCIVIVGYIFDPVDTSSMIKELLGYSDDILLVEVRTGVLEQHGNRRVRTSRTLRIGAFGKDVFYELWNTTCDQFLEKICPSFSTGTAATLVERNVFLLQQEA
ncbi:hypothetical protein RRF57_012479 [Xylaria bambusicola]|uniref:Uncharacterized protein n=1 Tax=Xylaria bambusicola TaxID=326684 RepID=A0AAN7ZAY9_9PEZI